MPDGALRSISRRHACPPADAPGVQAEAQRTLHLADKYNIAPLLAVCDNMLAEKLHGSSHDAPSSAEGLLKSLAVAMRLQLGELQHACSDVITAKLQAVCACKVG